MPSLVAARNYNAAYCPSHVPVAVFVGGTSGIGQAMVEAFAQYTNGRAHIIIVGRNHKAAESILASLPKPPPTESGWKHEFIACDITLFKNIYATTNTIIERVSKINYLVLSAGIANFSGRKNTAEGLDKKLIIRYYSRWALIDGLLPCLCAAKEKGEEAKVLSILGAGIAPKADMNDLGLRKNYYGLKAMLQTPAYNDLMVAEYSKRQPDIAFTHIYPGWVKTTPELDTWGMKVFYWITISLMWILRILMPAQESAEYMLFALFDGEKGMYRRGSKGDDIGMTRFPGTEEDQKLLWDHTAEVVHNARMSMN